MPLTFLPFIIQKLNRDLATSKKECSTAVEKQDELEREVRELKAALEQATNEKVSLFYSKVRTGMVKVAKVLYFSVSL